MRFAPCVLLALLALLLPGCGHRLAGAAFLPSPTSAAEDALAPGVVHRAIATGPDAGVDVIDVDLTQASARPAIVTGVPRHGRGPALTPEDWLAKVHALAAINGGYFGTADDLGHEEFVGLLVRGGHVVHSASFINGTGGAGLAPGRYVRSAFGLTRAGLPRIAWVAAAPRLVSYDSPIIGKEPGRRWNVWEAIGCGPTLIHNGQMVVTDRKERLASPGPDARTFVAYDGAPGTPQHFVMGVASNITFADLAAFVTNYFSRYDHTSARAAMCLDGGASSQLSFRAGRTIQSPRFTGVSVPDAVVITDH